MTWHILVMAQTGDLFSVSAGWSIGQRRLYGALLNKLRLDIVWLQCKGELRSSRRYTSRIGAARITGFVLKNTDTIAICVTAVTLGDGDGWRPGGGQRKPDLSQVESISEARLHQHGRMWRLAHISGEEFAAPGPVNRTVIGVPRVPRRPRGRVNAAPTEHTHTGLSHSPELLVSYRRLLHSDVASAAIRPDEIWNNVAGIGRAQIDTLIQSIKTRAAIRVLTSDPSDKTNDIRVDTSTSNHRMPAPLNPSNTAPSPRFPSMSKDISGNPSLQTFVLRCCANTTDSSSMPAMQPPPVRLPACPSKRERRRARTEQSDLHGLQSVFSNCDNQLLQ